jgi:hypothetical protein
MSNEVSAAQHELAYMTRVAVENRMNTQERLWIRTAAVRRQCPRLLMVDVAVGSEDAVSTHSNAS